MARSGMGPEKIADAMEPGNEAAVDYVYKVLSRARKKDPMIPNYSRKQRPEGGEKPMIDSTNPNDEVTLPGLSFSGPKSAIDRLDLKTDHASVLRDIFKQTLGVPSAQATSLLQEMDNRPDYFMDRPEELENTLRGMLSNQRASIVTHRWTSEMNPRSRPRMGGQRTPSRRPWITSSSSCRSTS
jgi:hypothetical protein